MQEPRNPGHIVVREQMCGVLVQESGGDEDFKPLVAIEPQDTADAIQDLAAHTTAARFEPAERTTIDLGQMSHLFLGQTALISESRQHTS